MIFMLVLTCTAVSVSCGYYYLSITVLNRIMSGKAANVKGKRKTKSARAGLTFSVARINKLLKRGKYARHISIGASVYLTAVLEYLSLELLEISGNVTQHLKKTRIVPRHIMLAVKDDEDIDKLLAGVTIPQAGVQPSIHAVLDPKKKENEAD